MSVLDQLQAGLARRVPHAFKAAYYRCRKVLPGGAGAYELICGKTLRRLRGDVLRRSGGASTVATTNCGLLASGTGFIGVYKAGTFNSCWELAIRVPRETEPGVRQTLWLADFDSRCRLVNHRPISATFADGAIPVERSGIVEDARLARHGEEIVITANFVPYPAGPESFPDQRSAWPLIGVLDIPRARIECRRMRLAGASPPQKNWVPFSVAGQLYLEYSVSPHRILAVDPATGACQTAWMSSTPAGDRFPPGYLKGGAPPISLGGSMLGACHAWDLNRDGQRDYRTYFYLFSSAPPFQVLGISRPLKLVVPHRIQYLVGMTLDEAGDRLVLSFGVCDCDNYFVGVPLRRILALIET